MSVKEIVKELKLKRKEKKEKELKEEKIKQTKLLEEELEKFKELFYNQFFNINSDKQEIAKKIEEIFYEREEYSRNAKIKLPFDIKILFRDNSLISTINNKKFSQWKEEIESICEYKIVFYKEDRTSEVNVIFNEM